MDLTGEEEDEESEPEEQQPPSPLVSPKRTGQQPKKTSITPILSKDNLSHFFSSDVNSVADNHNLSCFSCI